MEQVPEQLVRDLAGVEQAKGAPRPVHDMKNVEAPKLLHGILILDLISL